MGGYRDGIALRDACLSDFLPRDGTAQRIATHLSGSVRDLGKSCSYGFWILNRMAYTVWFGKEHFCSPLEFILSETFFFKLKSIFHLSHNLFYLALYFLSTLTSLKEVQSRIPVLEMRE